MKIFKKNVTKFIFSFIIILVIDLLLVFSVTAYLRNQDTTISIVENVSKSITHVEDNYKINQKGQDIIAENDLWLMIIDKDTGKEKYSLSFKRPNGLTSPGLSFKSSINSSALAIESLLVLYLSLNSFKSTLFAPLTTIR